MEKSRTTNEAYASMFNDMLENSKRGEYNKCAELCSDFTKFAWRLREDREIFIGEILESVFYQLGSELEMSDSSNNKNISEYKLQIHEQLSQLLKKVMESYLNGVADELYKSLTKIRATATHFQFTLIQLNGERNGK